jgi:hypothetical protein
MSHVDDGTLHTYLDGALDSLGSAEAARVREHLASCGACARRLEEEAAWRDEATAVLADAVPEVEDMPPFEDIRAVAAMARSPSAGWRMKRLAWAASMVLALGTGWMLRGASVPDSAELSAPAVQVLPTSPEEQGSPSRPPVATTEGGRSEAFGSTRERETDVSEAREVASAGPVDGRRGAVHDDPDLVATPVAENLAGEPEQKTTDAGAALSDRVALEAARPAEEVATLRGASDSSLVGVALERRVVAPEQLQPLRLPAASPGDAGVRAARDLQPSARVDALAMEEEALPDLPAFLSETSQPLVVPGLEVISVSWLSGADLDGAVRVLQRMERGDTLEIIHLPSGMDPAAMPPLPADGRTEVVMPRGAGWLVARARLPRQDLEAVLRELAPAQQ